MKIKMAVLFGQTLFVYLKSYNFNQFYTLILIKFLTSKPRERNLGWTFLKLI